MQNSVEKYCLIFVINSLTEINFPPLARISSSHSRTTWYILLIDHASKNDGKTKGTAVAVVLSIVLSIPSFEQLKVRRAVQNET